MAYTLVSYGSSGEEVKKLQTALNQKGYSLEVDGQFGQKTQAAVTDYQKKSGLTVDGKVGEQTWGSLLGNTEESTKNLSLSGVSDTASLQKSFAPSQQVQDAKAQYEALRDAQTPAYESRYEQKLSELMEQIQNQEKFTYDLSSDAAYRALQRQYTALGTKAMEDTMGQAAALTGGYGSSYSQTAGQQQYAAYLSKLWEQVPALQENAYAKYRDETEDLYDRYETLRKAESENL